MKNQDSAENAHTDYPNYLADEQRRKVLATYETIKERMVKVKEDRKELQLQIEGV